MVTTWLWYSLLVLFPVFVAAWWQQQQTKNAGWVDVLWALSVAGLGAFYAIAGTGDLALRSLVGLIYLMWFGRLTFHLWRRVHNDSEEDGRYANMRSWAGPKAGLAFLVLYLLQASWVWLFTLPAWVLAHGQWPGAGWVTLAIMIAIGAFVGEAIADKQLRQFKQQHQHLDHPITCRAGLWRYSRHPNYFFEWCHWFAYPVLGVASAYGQWLLLAPVAMFIFLYYFTGIPYTERQALRRRGDDYRRYQATTSMFFPWPPKSISAKSKGVLS